MIGEIEPDAVGLPADERCARLIQFLHVGSDDMLIVGDRVCGGRGAVGLTDLLQFVVHFLIRDRMHRTFDRDTLVGLQRDRRFHFVFDAELELLTAFEVHVHHRRTSDRADVLLVHRLMEERVGDVVQRFVLDRFAIQLLDHLKGGFSLAEPLQFHLRAVFRVCRVEVGLELFVCELDGGFMLDIGESVDRDLQRTSS